MLIFKLSSQTNTPLSSVISLSCVRAWVVMYYTEVFSENVATVLVFDILGWWLYPRHSGSTLCLFPIYRASAVYEHRTSFQRTHGMES